MKRSTFILAALAATAAITLPVGYFISRTNLPEDSLAWPEALAELTDEKTIREIGIHYKKQFPSENTKERLRELLITDQHGRSTAPTNDPELCLWIKEKIRQDFSSFKTTTVNGWVISLTETRQCALYSLL